MFPTIMQSPDALVFINGELDIQGCPNCHRRFDLNKYITSVQVELNVDSVPGSANIALSIPRHSIDDFIMDGDCVLSPMMEVEIYAKGAFLVEGVPQYYPLFWGIITDVSESYNDGSHGYTVQCADILKWWDLCKMNINPAFTQTKGQMGSSIFGNVLFGTNPYDMIWTLALQSFGDVVVGTGSLISLVKENQQKQVFNAALGDIMLYWQQRFSKIRSNLLMYGTQGNAVRGDVLFAKYQKQGGSKAFRNSGNANWASQAVRQANGGDSGSQMVFDPTDPGVTAFRTQFSQAGQVNFWQSEYQSKLEIANACKEAIGFEFYMDVTGDIVFKPPFFNLDVIGNRPVSWIQDADVISWDRNNSESEVITQIQISGSYGGNVDYGFGEEATPTTSVTDYHLLRKYGWRSDTFNSEFMASPLLMFYTGMDMLDRRNATRYSTTINIPLRPELRLGFPIYLAPRNEVWYVKGLSHSIEMGGRATTGVTVTARRTPFVAPKGIGTIELSSFKGGKNEKPDQNLKERDLSSKQLRDGAKFKVDVGDAAQIPPDPSKIPTDPSLENPYEPLILRDPKTQQRLGYPNVVLAYTRPFNPPPDSLKASAGQKGSSEPRAASTLRTNVEQQGGKIIEKVNEEHTELATDRLREKLNTNRYSYGLNSAGVYTYLEDLSAVIKDVLIMPIGNIDFGSEGAAFDKQRSGMLRPISDERGFEVIGHFRYGRNVSLRDGSIVLSSPEGAGKNSRAVVEPQIALSGGLFETLQAQSRGLTNAPLSDFNPSHTLATMTLDDLKTGARINQDTGEPEYTENGSNFIDSAPLGSTAQSGAENKDFQASVEATQLSRALTLAEMSVRNELMGDASDCGCFLGRPDLAFIGAGYKLKVIRATVGDSSTVAYGAAGSASVENTQLSDGNNAALFEERQRVGQEAYDSTYKEQSSEGYDPFTPEEQRRENAEVGAFQAQVEAQVQFDKDHPEVSQIASNEDVGALTEAIREGRPIQVEAGLSRQKMISIVDSFLANLYSALDVSHQEYEKALRGEMIDVPEVSPQVVRFEDPSSNSYAQPPFGPGYRATGGDPQALAATADAALGDFEKDWYTYGRRLAAIQERAALEEDLAALRQEEAKIQAQIEIAIFEEGPIINGQVPSTPEIRALQERLAQVQQSIKQKEMELAQLSQ